MLGTGEACPRSGSLAPAQLRQPFLGFLLEQVLEEIGHVAAHDVGNGGSDGRGSLRKGDGYASDA